MLINLFLKSVYFFFRQLEKYFIFIIFASFIVTFYLYFYFELANIPDDYENHLSWFEWFWGLFKFSNGEKKNKIHRSDLLSDEDVANSYLNQMSSAVSTSKVALPKAPFSSRKGEWLAHLDRIFLPVSSFQNNISTNSLNRSKDQFASDIKFMSLRLARELEAYNFNLKLQRVPSYIRKRKVQQYREARFLELKQTLVEVYPDKYIPPFRTNLWPLGKKPYTG